MSEPHPRVTDAIASRGIKSRQGDEQTGCGARHDCRFTSAQGVTEGRTTRGQTQRKSGGYVHLEE